VLRPRLLLLGLRLRRAGRVAAAEVALRRRRFGLARAAQRIGRRRLGGAALFGPSAHAAETARGRARRGARRRMRRATGAALRADDAADVAHVALITEADTVVVPGAGIRRHLLG